jgi:hypothetical protein
MATWQEAQRMMREAKTPGEKVEALRAFQESVPQSMQSASIVTMSKGSSSNVVRLSDLSGQANNPEVFERLRKLAGGK